MKEGEGRMLRRPSAGAGPLFALLALSVGIASPPAPAAHDVPRRAGPLHFEFVPNFRQTISTFQCGARGGRSSTHGPPLANESCDPPAFLPGTIAHMGSNAQSDLEITPLPGDTDPANGDQADMIMSAVLTDIRVLSPTGSDYNPVGAAGAPDLTYAQTVRISDHYNTSPGGTCPANGCPATMSEFVLMAPVECGATADTSTGSVCALSTTFESFIPLNPGDIADTGISENKQTVMQVFSARFKDVGTDGDLDTQGDNKVAFMEGYYVP